MHAHLHEHACARTQTHTPFGQGIPGFCSNYIYIEPLNYINWNDLQSLKLNFVIHSILENVLISYKPRTEIHGWDLLTECRLGSWTCCLLWRGSPAFISFIEELRLIQESKWLAYRGSDNSARLQRFTSFESDISRISCTQEILAQLLFLFL